MRSLTTHLWRTFATVLIRRLARSTAASLALVSVILVACDDRENPAAPLSAQPSLTDAPAIAAPPLIRFSAPQFWSPFLCRAGEICHVADVNGDRRADAIAFSHGANGSTAVYVAKSTGTAFAVAQQWHPLFCRRTEQCAVGDVNNDGRADLIAFTRGTTSDVWVATSNGTSFNPAVKWHDLFCRTGEVCRVGDVNGDRQADLIAFRHGLNNTNSVFVGLSTGGSFAAAQRWHTRFCLQTEACEVADVSGNARADIIAFTLSPKSDVYVGRANGASFTAPALWSGFFCRSGEVCLTGDFNRDLKADVIAFNHGRGGLNAVYVAASTGAAFLPSAQVLTHFCTATETCAVGDVTGDLRADLIAFTRGTTPQAWVSVSLP
jgi:hypothetical protein